MSDDQSNLEFNGVPVCDTFAEAFPAVGTRLIITAASPAWAHTAAAELCGYATSVISCDAEAAVERAIPESDSPDGRPAVSVLVFAFNRKALEEAVANRVGQCVLTCPTTACYAGLLPNGDDAIRVGGRLRYFGDGFQSSKLAFGRRFWRIPVMDGEFVCEDRFGSTRGVAGGNLLICGRSPDECLRAAEQAVAAIGEIRDVMLPFPGGLVRSGSKVGSRYKALKASTNDAWCPTLRARTDSELPVDVSCVYEIVIDGLHEDSVQAAMQTGLRAACRCDGVLLISAGNYGGKLGPYHFHLKDLLHGD